MACGFVSSFLGNLPKLGVTYALCGLSFLQNILFINKDPISMFFLPQSRIWELLLGSILAFKTKNSIPTKNPDWVSSFGLGFVFLSLVIPVEQRNFPGWFALLPTLGTLLIIKGGETSWINKKILSNHFMVGIGHISFPLYLWHWPLLSFSRIIEGHLPTALTRLGLIFLSLALSWFTWRFIEKPIRFGSHFSQKAYALAGCLFALGLIGLFTSYTHGFPLRRYAKPHQLFSGDIGQDEFYSYLAASTGKSRCYRNYWG